ncbi:MAG: hypothetical protein ABIE03_00180 [Patescibacteria group bacterium]|nr:hypothetical protein [Patescibacteria group bacterium]
MKSKAIKYKSKEFINSIKNAIPRHCSNCGTQYADNDLSLIQRDDYAAMLHLTCQSCKESYLINVVSPLGSLQGSSRVPLKIDILSPEEAKKFIGKSAIKSDDILDLHEILSKIETGEDLKKVLK